MNNLLILNIQSFWEHLKPLLCHLDLAIAWSIRQGLALKPHSQLLSS